MPAPRQRAQRKRIQVTFPDNTKYCFNNAVDTVIATLRKIGPERFPEIKLTRNHHRLISTEAYPELKEYMKEISPGWFYNIQSNTDEKFRQLELINETLRLGLELQKGTELQILNAAERGPKSKKKRLSVTFEDDVVIEFESHKSTFQKCVEIIGPEKIPSNWRLHGYPFIYRGTQRTANNQVQVAENIWLTIPNTSKEAFSALQVLNSSLQLNLKIELR